MNLKYITNLGDIVIVKNGKSYYEGEVVLISKKGINIKYLSEGNYEFFKWVNVIKIKKFNKYKE